MSDGQFVVLAMHHLQLDHTLSSNALGLPQRVSLCHRDATDEPGRSKQVNALGPVWIAAALTDSACRVSPTDSWHRLTKVSVPINIIIIIYYQ
jgi:hypothetical protein